MKKGIVVIVIILVLLGVGYGCLYFYSNQEYKKIMNKVEQYDTLKEISSTGVIFDFSSDSKIKSSATAGKIFKDVNGDIKIIENIKILLLNCNENGCKLFNSGENNSSSDLTDKYEIEDPIILKDGTKWHVIKESSEYSNYISLVRDERLDINGDGISITTGMANEPDRKAFDTSGSKKYDDKSPTNLGYYLNTTYKSSLTKLNDIIEIRILDVKEIENIVNETNISGLSAEQVRDMQDTEEELIGFAGSDYDFGRLKTLQISQEQYQKLNPHWLWNGFSGNYWVTKGNSVTTEIWSGFGTANYKATTPAGVKPVIVLNKSNIN